MRWQKSFEAHKISSKWKTLTSKQRSLNTYTQRQQIVGTAALCTPGPKSTPNDGHMRQVSQKKKPTNRETKKEMKRIDGIDDEDEQAEEHAKGYGKNV